MNLTTMLLMIALHASNMHEDHTAKYHLSFRQDLPTVVSVEASLPYSEVLKVSTYGAWSQANGWGTFIKDLQVFDENGNPLTIAKKEKCVWAVAKSESARLRVEYDVILSHAKVEEWPDGPKTTGAFWDGTALFTVTAPLILFNDEANGYQFDFDVPENCQIYTGWKPGRSSNQYFCDSTDEAIENTIVLGDPDVVNVETPCFNVSVTLLGGFRGKSKLIGPVVERFLKYYEGFYREKNKHNYLVVMFPQSLETGEAYAGSYVHVSPQIPTEENRPIWAGIVAHELGHFWLGKQIAAKEWAAANWFSEGATEYMATLAMVRCGEINNSEFLDIVRRNVEFYILFKKGKPFESVSLVEAGSNKSSNNVAIYNGGWVASFCLDVLIRERTDNQKSFDDFMRQLNSDFGQTNTKYGLDDLIHVANSVSNSNTRDFFNRYVIGKETFPIDDFLNRAGMKASLGAASAYIDLDSRASGLPKDIRSSLFCRQSTELENAINKVFEKWNHVDSAGATVTITHKGQMLLSRSYGAANLEFSAPINSETSFHAASVAKQFTAYLVMLLNERGNLSLDDPVSKFLPDMPQMIGAVTIQQLLDHTSGIRDQWQLLALSGVQPEDLVTQDQILQLIERQTDLQFAPGTKQAYCNSGYTLLAAIVEKASGQSFRQFSEDEIFRPLKMRRTFFRDSISEIVPNRATSYRIGTNSKAEKRELNYVTYGATSLHTCGADMGLWMLHLVELYNSESSLLGKMMKRGTLQNGDEINFSNGLFVDHYRETLMLGHPGADAGFRSAVFVFPELELGVTVLANVNNIDHWQLPKTIADFFLEKPSAAEEEDSEVAPNPQDNWIGSFVSKQGKVIVIDRRFGKLCFSMSPDFKISELSDLAPGKFQIGNSNRTLKFSDVSVDGKSSKTVSVTTDSIIEAQQRGKMTSTELASLVGVYCSSELDSCYSVVLRDGQLCLKHARNGVIKLQEKSVDRFSADAWFIPEVQFIRDKTQKVLRFEVRLHDERGIRFECQSR